MFEINIKVNGNGTLNIGNADRIKLGTENEVNRVKLVFDVDSSIEGVYQYVKFNKGNTAHLYRVTQKELVVSKTILASSGIWLLSFISSSADTSFCFSPLPTVLNRKIGTLYFSNTEFLTRSRSRCFSLL